MAPDEERPPEGEEDWFDDPERTWTQAPREPEPRRPEPDAAAVERRNRLVIGAIAGGIAVLLVAVAIARIAGGDDDGAAETAPLADATGTGATDAPAPTTTAPPDSTITLPRNTVLRPGSEGAEVEALQRALAELGYNPGRADGVYGTRTAEAVERFQTQAGLDSDGIAGPSTLRALQRALARG